MFLYVYFLCTGNLLIFLVLVVSGQHQGEVGEGGEEQVGWGGWDVVGEGMEEEVEMAWSERRTRNHF